MAGSGQSLLRSARRLSEAPTRLPGRQSGNRAPLPWASVGFRALSVRLAVIRDSADVQFPANSQPSVNVQIYGTCAPGSPTPLHPKALELKGNEQAKTQGSSGTGGFWDECNATPCPHSPTWLGR